MNKALIIKGYAAKEYAALKLLTESGCVCVDEDVWDELYERIKQTARFRSHNYTTYDEVYKWNLRRAKVCWRNHDLPIEFRKDAEVLTVRRKLRKRRD